MNPFFNYNSKRLNGLDHLRALAILLVMVFHYGRGIPSWLEPVRQIGWTGVDLFFVLSGYLIGSILLKEYDQTREINFKQYFIKRTLRIIPAYIAVLGIYYALPNLREGSGMPPLWKFLTFTQNLGLDAQHHKSFTHAWSLCIEEQFYLLLPFIIVTLFYFKVQKATPYLLIALVGLGFVLRSVNWYEHVQPFIDSGNRREMVYGFLEKIYYPSYNRMDGLLIGVGIALVLRYQPKVKDLHAKHGNFILLIGTGVFAVAYIGCESLISRPTAIYGFPLISLAYGVMVMAAVSPSCVLYKVKSKLSVIIATLSYSVYLIHKQVFFLTKKVIGTMNMDKLEAWTFWIGMLVSFIIAMLLYLLVEKPFMKLRSQILRKMASE